MRAPVIVEARGSVVQVSPALFTEKGAALYCSCSPGFLRALRSADTKALKGGAPTSGPEWRVLSGSMIRYSRDALDAWISRASVPFATVESKRRAAKGVA